MDDVIKLINEQRKDDNARIEKRLDNMDKKLDNLFTFKAKIVGAAALIATALNIGFSIGCKLLLDF